MKLLRLVRLGATCCCAYAALHGQTAWGAEPIHVTYLWHMHQPIYYPYLSVQDTDNLGVYSFSVSEVHHDRQPNYTCWPRDAIQQGQDKGIAHAGAQCSFSGSLIENLNGLWGHSTTAGWDDCYDWARNGLKTAMNNARLNMVGFAYHHSLMPLTCPESRRKQIQLHKEIYAETWDTGGAYSRGFFPPETAFADVIIPELVAEGIEWVLVDNIHFDRACENYPWNAGGGIYRPNRADVQNPDPGTWIQLNNVWAPTRVSAPFGYQPHYVQHIEPDSPDPENPIVHKIIAVPAARYEGNENARGGYGAFKPENVWTDTSPNNDPDHPMIMVCHSDGDNFGLKNSDAWHAQHGFFLDMTMANPDFEHTAVQDYLELFPPDPNDIIHVEPGSWAGADTGDPEFKKWLADPPNDGRGQNPDRFSWSVLIAAQNRVLHADDLDANYSINDIRWGIGNGTARAWHFYLNAEASDYWYWDTDDVNPWNGNVTRACNLAVVEADTVIDAQPGVDFTAPSIFPPQREPYNPGGFEFDEPNPSPSDFEVFSYVYDVSGLASVTLYWRTDKDGQNPIGTYDNELYAPADENEVNAWNTLPMTAAWIPANKGPGPVPDPIYRAQTYSVTVTGQSEVLIDYYVEAVDVHGNVRRSDIKHVYVGPSTGGAPVVFSPSSPTDCDELTVTYDPTGRSLDAAVAVDMVWTFDGFSTTQTNEMADAGSGQWLATVTIPQGTTSVEVYFEDGDGALADDTNEGANWATAVSECAIASHIAFEPAAPVGCNPVTLTYFPGTGVLKDAAPVHIHIGRNGWTDVISPAPAMTQNPDGSWSYTYAVPEGTHQINCVFNDGDVIWDNNGGNDWALSVADCTAPAQSICLAYGSPAVSPWQAEQNRVGDNFDLSTAGGSLSTVSQGGFGDFGELYVNFDETNLYLGATGTDMVGDNNALVLFLGCNTLADDAFNLWHLSGTPQGLDNLHNIAFTTPMDLAILLGDEHGDITENAAPLGNGFPFGQGAFYLSRVASNFTQVAGARISQFDGVGTTPTSTTNDDGDRVTDRWEVCIPWASLAVTRLDQLTSLHIGGVIASDGESGFDRYLSGNYLGAAASGDQPLDAFNNFRFGFVTLTPVEVCLDGTATDGDQMEDLWEVRHGLNAVDPVDAEQDLDGDGFLNLFERVAGTDPTNGDAHLRVESIHRLPGGKTVIEWPSEFGKRYDLYRTSDLISGPFEPVASGLVATPPMNTTGDTPAAGEVPYYYSVVVRDAN